MKFSIHSKNVANKFSSIFTNLSTLTDNVSMFFRDEGLYIQGMDNSHISLYEVNFDKSWFTTYKREINDATKITINLDYFKRILSTRGDKQSICIEYKGENPDKLSITFRTVISKSKEFPREYEMSLMDIDEEMLDITKKEQSVVFFMDTKMFSSLIKQLSMFDETVFIKCNENDINFQTKGSEGSMSVNLMDNTEEYVDQFEIEEDYELKVYFSIRYIDSFCSFSKVSDRVRISFTNDFPIEVYYSLEEDEKETSKDDENTPKSWLRLLLAPKIMDDEDEEKYKGKNKDEEDEDEDDDDEEDED